MRRENKSSMTTKRENQSVANYNQRTEITGFVNRRLSAGLKIS